MNLPEIPSVNGAPQDTESGGTVPHTDFRSVIEAMLSVQQPTGESSDFNHGWYSAMNAVAAAASFDVAYAYRLNVDVHTGWVSVDKDNARLLHERGERVQRRAAGPWESLPRHADI